MIDEVTNLDKKEQTCKKNNKNKCRESLKEILPGLFEAFYRARQLYDVTASFISAPISTRNYDAVTLNHYVIQVLYSLFPQNFIFMKHGRIALRANGYIIFIKKLDKYDMPTNIPTRVSEELKNQNLGCLFPEYDNGHETILFFGYKKDNFGNFISPKLVCINGDRVIWSITENEIYESGDKEIPLKQVAGDSIPKVSVKRREERKIK